jgi:hypothetical protein
MPNRAIAVTINTKGVAAGTGDGDDCVVTVHVPKLDDWLGLKYCALSDEK